MIKDFADHNTKKFWDTGKSKGMAHANLRKATAEKKLAILHTRLSLSRGFANSARAISWRPWWATGSVNTVCGSNTSFGYAFVWRDGDAYEVEIADYN